MSDESVQALMITGMFIFIGYAIAGITGAAWAAGGLLFVRLFIL